MLHYIQENCTHSCGLRTPKFDLFPNFQIVLSNCLLDIFMWVLSRHPNSLLIIKFISLPSQSLHRSVFPFMFGSPSPHTYHPSQKTWESISSFSFQILVLNCHQIELEDISGQCLQLHSWPAGLERTELPYSLADYQAL